MSALKKLAGKRIAVLAADGFEKEELAAPVEALKAAGADVVIVALHPGRIRGMSVHQPAELVAVDKTVGKARAEDYDGLVIPGGYISPDLLRQSAPARDFICAVNALGTPIVIMSQAALVMVSAGLARDRTLTSWPGVRDDMVNAGATWLNEEVVRDANWLSSRGPQDVAAVLREMVPLFAGEPEVTRTRRPPQSDPQPEEPSEVPGQPLRWLATPSVGTMLGLALLGVGVVAASRGRRGKPDAAVPATALALPVPEPKNT
ncbi:glutamine amidotransferase [Massilia eurypsychrophila]|uniref:Glutamine amidotransferase n=1 Tax=Massilia eurypsychrophila TaxID=1485217 RepID=A0A2G8TIG3_9BURK|nr:DJ-1/PfpI family protein [Massilia eurypsychrophila]PIL45822.1 glutamine amidotransferase [Massilia eurypsychrophila]